MAALHRPHGPRGCPAYLRARAAPERVRARVVPTHLCLLGSCGAAGRREADVLVSSRFLLEDGAEKCGICLAETLY